MCVRWFRKGIDFDVLFYTNDLMDTMRIKRIWVSCGVDLFLVFSKEKRGKNILSNFFFRDWIWWNNRLWECWWL